MSAVCKLGTLVVKGSDIRFEKASPLDFSHVVASDAAELAIDYEVIEASVMKENVLIRLRVTTEDGGAAEAKAETKDRLGSKDVQRGTLALRLPLPKAARIEGRFEVTADHGKKSWFSRIRGSTSSFSTGDRFSLAWMPKPASAPKPTKARAK